MSRGPGRWQRAILDALTASEWILLCDVLPPGPTRAQLLACRRAANRLEAQGLVQTRALTRRLVRGLTPEQRKQVGETILLRPGVELDRDRIYQERIRPLHDGITHRNCVTCDIARSLGR